MNESKRRQRLRSRLRKLGLPAILITDIVNVRYLTGFTGSSAYLLLTKDTDWLLSDTRYEVQLQHECPDLELEIRTAKSTMLDSVERVVTSAGIKALGFENHRLIKSEFDQLETRLAGTELVATEQLVEELRAVKDRHEIQAIRRSIDINQRAFEVIVAQLRPDQTERDIAHNLEHQMRAFGAAGFAFPAIVGVGPRAALPHGVPGSTRIDAAPFLLVDWGAKVDGYLSDLTRVIVTGRCRKRFRQVYDVVLEAQQAAIAAIAPGVSFQTVDRAARSVIENAGFGKYFGHGTGHSFGLEIHELPYLSPIHEGELKPGMVITIEPGIYLPDFGGVRIEDDILVTPAGREVLSNLPKEFEQCRRHLGD